jgi:hypothetical protein
LPKNSRTNDTDIDSGFLEIAAPQVRCRENIGSGTVHPPVTCYHRLRTRGAAWIDRGLSDNASVLQIVAV